jgi:hypothetical protein
MTADKSKLYLMWGKVPVLISHFCEKWDILLYLPGGLDIVGEIDFIARRYNEIHK